MKERKLQDEDEILDMLGIEIPEGVGTDCLPSPELLQYYKNLKNRILWIDCGVDEELLEIEKTIIDINLQDKDIPVEERKPIKVLIFSYGGDANVCFSLLDIMNVSKTPVYTYNMGVAMSAGGLLFLAGKKRFTMPNATVLIHSGSGGAQGTYEQVKAQMKDYDKFAERMKKYILEHTKIDAKLYAKHKSEEWYVYAEEQVKLGIADGIITSIDEIF